MFVGYGLLLSPALFLLGVLWVHFRGTLVLPGYTFGVGSPQYLRVYQTIVYIPFLGNMYYSVHILLGTFSYLLGGVVRLAS